MRPALEGLCHLTDLAYEGGDDVLARELTRWAADVHAATLAVRAGKPEAAAQLRASALARVAQVSAVGQRLSVEQVYHASKLPPAVLLHEAMRALARGDALAAAAAVDEAQALLGGEVGACRCACERLPDAAEAAETWCQICGVDTVPPAAYCPTCDAILACGGVG